MRESFEADLINRWRAGNLVLSDEKETMGRTRTLLELERINPDDFEMFLGLDQPTPEENDETEDS